MRNLLGRLRRPISRSQLTRATTLISDGDGSTLSLDFTAMSSLDSRFTFTRASTATFINSSGLVTTMAAASTNDPTKARFDYDPTTLAPRGLLIEGSATNLTRSSQDLTNATYWTLQTAYASTSATGNTAPDNTNTGNLFTEPSTNVQRSIYQSFSSAAGTYTFSVWLKAGSGSTRYMRLVVSSGASDFGYVTINMSTGAIQQAATAVGTATSASATTSGSYTATGWRRYSLTITLAASVNFVFLVPIDLLSIDTPTGNYGRVAYLGDGSSFLIWGTQLEAGSGASSYIPTGASTVQRAADSCSIALSSFDFSTTGGTFFADWYRKNNDSGTQGGGPWNTDYATTRWFGVQNSVSSNTVSLFSWSGQTNIANGSTRNKAAATYGAWTGSVVPATFCVNNSAVSSANRDFNPSLATYLTIGAASSSAGSSPAYGVATRDWLNNSIRSIKYWPSILPDATLQSLTQ